MPGSWSRPSSRALAFGLPALTDGRFRGTHRWSSASERRRRAVETTPGAALIASMPDATLGERATLLQFSSAFCAPCRATRRVLAEVTGLVDGVAHVEIDAEHHLEVVRRLGILRTPTTIVLDAAGAEVTRATGAPRKDQVLDRAGARP